MTSQPSAPRGASRPPPSLPARARLPINRCNLPAVILGSLTYQAHPVPLELDGIVPLHRGLFEALDCTDNHAARAGCFMNYMTLHFRLETLEDAGLMPGIRRKRSRAKANYLRMVRGWAFDSDGREGAVLKSWVETRFGLLAQHHGGDLGDSETRHAYMRQAAAGIYATNAVEAQLDLLYTYCQYELACQHPTHTSLTLYRGINRVDEHEVLGRNSNGHYQVLMNNLSSFTASRERADEFGDYILEVIVPLPKIFFYHQLLPGILKGEDELVVIGGVYEVKISTF